MKSALEPTLKFLGSLAAWLLFCAGLGCFCHLTYWLFMAGWWL